MKQINQINLIKRIKAFGLVEVLVGLAITGGVLITITSVALSAYRQVKDNEVSDYANGLMLMSVEYFKTPVSNIDVQPAKTLNLLENGESKVYAIKSDVDGPSSEFAISEITSPITNTHDLVSCDSSSDFSVNYSSSAVQKPLLCNKIVIARDINGGFLITSTIAYQNFSGDLVYSKIIGYRQRI